MNNLLQKIAMTMYKVHCTRQTVRSIEKEKKEKRTIEKERHNNEK